MQTKQTKIVHIIAEHDSKRKVPSGRKNIFWKKWKVLLRKKRFAELSAASGVIRSFRRHSHMSQKNFRLKFRKRLRTKLRYWSGLRRNSQLTALLTLRASKQCADKTSVWLSLRAYYVFFINWQLNLQPLSNPSFRLDKISQTFYRFDLKWRMLKASASVIREASSSSQQKK